MLQVGRCCIKGEVTWRVAGAPSTLDARHGRAPQERLPWRRRRILASRGCTGGATASRATPGRPRDEGLRAPRSRGRTRRTLGASPRRSRRGRRGRAGRPAEPPTAPSSSTTTPASRASARSAPSRVRDLPPDVALLDEAMEVARSARRQRGDQERPRRAGLRPDRLAQPRRGRALGGARRPRARPRLVVRPRHDRRGPPGDPDRRGGVAPRLRGRGEDRRGARRRPRAPGACTPWCSASRRPRRTRPTTPASRSHTWTVNARARPRADGPVGGRHGHHRRRGPGPRGRGGRPRARNGGSRAPPPLE